MPFAITLDRFCNVVRRAGFEVALMADQATFLVERGNEPAVVAQFHDNGTCTLTKNGESVSLAELVH